MHQDNMKQFRDTNYYITDNGEVYSNKPSGLKKLTIRLKKDGYYTIGLNFNGIRKFFRVHRLVAECYLDNHKGLQQVNHLNGIKTDNRVENLEWVNQSQNINHGYKNGLIPSGEKSHMSKLKKVDIDFIRKNYEYKSKLYNSKTLGKMFGVGHAQILRIVKNKLWKYEEYVTK